MFGGASQLTITAEHCFAKRCAQRFDYNPLGSSRKLEGVAEHLIDGSERRICRLSFFDSPPVIERRSNMHSFPSESPSLKIQAILFQCQGFLAESVKTGEENCDCLLMKSRCS